MGSDTINPKKPDPGLLHVAPTVSPHHPANGSTHVSGQALIITANAADSDGSIASVAFYANSAVLHTATSPPYTLTTSLAAGSYSLTAIATDNQGAATTSTPVNITVTPAANIAPTVSMTGPADASSYAPPANITLTATASDSDGSITAVEFYNGATLIGSVTTPPYTATWSNVPLGNYSVRARAVDNQGAATYSNTIAVNVNAVVASGVYYLYADHLNTPRVITDTSNKVVWRWDSDPFGADAANEDPDGDGTKFRYNPRFPGQYFDKETNLHYNYFRDYEPTSGRYIESDPIGLAGGLNTYGYVRGDPIRLIDPYGLAGFGDFSKGAGSYIRGFYRATRQLSRSYGVLGECEKQRSAEEDGIFQDIIAELRDNQFARDMAAKEVKKYMAENGTYLKGRATMGAAVSVVTPGGLGIGVTAIAAYGDMRYAIEGGADAVGAALGGATGDVLIQNPRARSNACTCR